MLIVDTSRRCLPQFMGCIYNKQSPLAPKTANIDFLVSLWGKWHFSSAGLFNIVIILKHLQPLTALHFKDGFFHSYMNCLTHLGQGPFYQHALTPIPALMINNIHYDVCDELFIRSQSSSVQPLKFGNRYVISSHTLQQYVITYRCMDLS